MEQEIQEKKPHIGRKIRGVRELRGLTQEYVADSLKISKQAVSKIEQSESVDDSRVKEIANVLGVTIAGLKNFNDDSILYSINFHDSSTAGNAWINPRDCTQINNPIEKVIELYESLLRSERDKVEILLNKSKG